MTEAIVFDNSAMMPLFLPDEDPSKALELTERSKQGVRLLCPSLWVYEFANVLTTGVRRGRISTTELHQMIRLAGQLPINIAPAPSPEQQPQIEIAVRHDLSLYDAAYLTLALEKGAALATYDKRLADAARESGVALI